MKLDTERSHDAPHIQFPMAVTSFKTIVQYQNQGVGVDAIHQSYTVLPVLMRVFYAVLSYVWFCVSTIVRM